MVSFVKGVEMFASGFARWLPCKCFPYSTRVEMASRVSDLAVLEA